MLSEELRGKRLYLVGPLPKPIGGVSTYIYRLLKYFPDSYSAVYDIYKNSEKEKVNSRSFISPFENRLLSIIWLAYVLPKKKDDFIHFNFSGVISLILFSFFVKSKSEWGVTLHNGELCVSNSVVLFFIRVISKKIDRFFYISDNQKKFYKEKLLIDDGKLFNLDSYVPPIIQLDEKGKLEDFGIEHVNKFDFVALANGYFKPIYNFEFILDAARLKSNILFLVVTYGESNRNYEEKINSIAECLDNVVFLNEISPDDFVRLLDSIDIYLRPNFVDSFGLAVADAVSLSKQAIASDVCGRANGCMLFKSGCFRDFMEKFEYILTKNQASKDGFYTREKVISKYKFCYGIKDKL
ncbi:glycosyltransferase [Pseudoalteromonas byunsanensis]|uniref:Glycosyl transferase family 1 domain-containing protein n=1 Tax=Pseudoalteromonas byunsanensis TaxID=327939 RepID=A0A1S1N776_9GAMM|nr:glycosyltransferase [Pseudoalteromonas byunsanensis]OHU95268.1 hypothetical protein BIW53_11150 [Pseudoalteromonas byunsanensis]